MDNGATMAPFWEAMTITIEVLSAKVEALDKNGLDLEFTLGTEHSVMNARRTRVLRAFEKAKREALSRPEDRRYETDIVETLTRVFQRYLCDARKATTLLVLTDAAWEATLDLRLVEKKIVEFLRRKEITEKMDDRWFSIEFISFGDAGIEKLRVLDDEQVDKYGIKYVPHTLPFLRPSRADDL